MTTVAQLIAQKEALEAQIEAARKAEISDAVAKVKELVAAHGLTAQDIFGGSKRGAKAAGGSKVARSTVILLRALHGLAVARHRSGLMAKSAASSLSDLFDPT